MSEEILEKEAAGEAGLAALPTVGAQLVAAREARGMTVADMAQTLKLGVRQVEALESGNWGALPGETFIRGFVRNYARGVQLDPTPLMAQLDQTLEKPKPRLDLPETAPTTMPSPGRSQNRDYAVALFGIALVVIALGINYLMPSDLAEFRNGLQSLISMGGRKEVAPPPAPTQAPTGEQEPVMPPGATAQQVLNPQAVPVAEAPGPAPLPPLQDAAVPATGTPVLRFVFDKESWVEVKDGDGKVIFSQKAAAGADQSVSGKGPFAVVIGNAPAVRVQLRGQAVDLAPHTRGDVARLTLD